MSDLWEAHERRQGFAGKHLNRSAKPQRQGRGSLVRTRGSHSCTMCGVPTQEALCGNRLLLRADVHRLPPEDAPPVYWRCATHQRYEMRQASGVHVSERGDLLYRLTCGHEVCHVFRGREAYTPARLQQALTTRQIRLDQPQRCYGCGELARESESQL